MVGKVGELKKNYSKMPFFFVMNLEKPWGPSKQWITSLYTQMGVKTLLLLHFSELKFLKSVNSTAIPLLLPWLYYGGPIPKEPVRTSYSISRKLAT